MQPVRSFLNSIKEANESCFLPIIRRHFSCSNVSQSRSFQRTMSGSRDVVIEAKDGKHSATIIFMHGLGDTGHGWADTLRQIKPDYVKLICPTAPVAPVSLNMGMPMPSWFDLFSLETDGLEDGEGVKKSSQTIVSLIEKEKTSHNIPADRILLGGFSQGGALALHTGVRYPEKLAGIIAFSCWLPLHKEYPGAFNQNCKDLAVLQCHGEADPLVMYDWGVRTSNLLKSFLTNHEFKSYPNMGHSSCNEELKDAQIFISKVLPEK